MLSYNEPSIICYSLTRDLLSIDSYKREISKNSCSTVGQSAEKIWREIVEISQINGSIFDESYQLLRSDDLTNQIK